MDQPRWQDETRISRSIVDDPWSFAELLTIAFLSEDDRERERRQRGMLGGNRRRHHARHRRDGPPTPR